MAEHREQRGGVEQVYALVALAGMVLVLWERLDPDGPREAWARARGRAAEYLSYRRAMQATLEEIGQLPETDGRDWRRVPER